MWKRIKAIAKRLDAVLPDQLELSSSRELVGERAKRWRWPAFQMLVAGALAYFVARRLDLGSASYAPIVAIGALGLGRERRLGRSALMLAGLALGVVTAEIATPLLGVGWWQLGLLVGVTALVAGAFVDRELAVTYAVINVVVLVTLPGSEGWVPDRLVSGTVGVGIAVTVMLVVLPPHPTLIVRRRLRRSIDLAREAIESTTDQLRKGRPSSGPAFDGGDDRPLISASRRLDQEIERSHDAAEQALEIARWSPLRRGQRDEVAKISDVAHDLRPALRTVSTIARLGDRAVLTDITADEPLLDALDAAAGAACDLASRLVDGGEPAPGFGDDVRSVIADMLDAPADNAILVALREETRGLYADLADALAHATDRDERSTAGGRSGGGISYGT